jgi:hypothetical protein
MSALNGFTDYFKYGLVYSAVNSIEHKSEVGYLNSVSSAVYGAEYASNLNKQGDKHSIGMLKDGNTVYVFADGKLISSYDDVDGGTTIPAIYVQGAAVSITDLSFSDDADEVQKVLDDNPFYVGGYVTVLEGANGKEYKLMPLWMGNDNNIDWPPVNNFINGLLLRKSYTGDYTIEFTVSDLDIVSNVDNANKNRDGKLLVYLKSEATSSSLQFVFEQGKDKRAEITSAFVPCFNDDTFTEYDLPEGMSYSELWEDKAVTIKVVKTHDYVELYINGTRVFENMGFMNNNGEWGTQTVCTPGIGSFACGMTISNISITKN